MLNEVDVNHIAKLARLELTKNELKEFQNDLH